MRRLVRIVLPAVLCLGVGADDLTAQTSAPTQTTPPDKIDPNPIQPDVPTQRSPTPAEFAAIPAKIWALRIIGGWEVDGKRGFSRLIGAFEGDKQTLTVQWLAEPDGRVVETKELEDEEAAKLTFGDFRAEPEDQGGVTVFLDTLPDEDGIRDTWVLVVGGPGDARFGPASN